MDNSITVLVFDVITMILWAVPLLTSIIAFAIYREVRTKDARFIRGKNAAMLMFLIAFIGMIFQVLFLVAIVALRVTGSQEKMMSADGKTSVMVHSHTKLIFGLSLTVFAIYAGMGLAVFIAGMYSLQMLRTSAPYTTNPDDHKLKKLFAAILVMALISLVTGVISMCLLAVTVYFWNTIRTLVPDESKDKSPLETGGITGGGGLFGSGGVVGGGLGSEGGGAPANPI